jgi:AAA domain
VTAVLEDLGSLTDDDLAGMYAEAAAADDAAVVRTALGVLRGRDAADRAARARDVLAGIRHEAECAVHAQFLAASAFCAGRLLSREGMAAGVAERDLWRMPERDLQRFASQELLDHLMFVQPRLTVAGYIRQHAAESRAARLEALDQAEADASDDITEEEVFTDDRLAGNETGSLRPGPAAGEAPAAGAGTVRGGGHPPGPGAGADGRQAGAADGGAGRPAEPAGGVVTASFMTFAEITPCDPEWVWQGRIPCGTVTVLAAPGGVGKSFFAADLAARVSRGDMMADGTPGSLPAPVVFIGLEDSPEASTVHRLTAAQANLASVIDASEGPSGAPFDVTEDLPWLREVNDRAGGVRLVVLDTLSAASPVSLTAVATVRNRVLRPLLAFAKDTGAAVLAVHHTTKAGDVAGSKAIVDGVRQVLMIERDTADPRIRQLRVHKTNVASDQTAGVRYTLAGEGRDTAVSWLTDIGQHYGRGPASDGQARVLLLLRNTSAPLSAQEIASKTGISYATVRVLLHRLGGRGLVASPARNAYTASPAA